MKPKYIIRWKNGSEQIKDSESIKSLCLDGYELRIIAEIDDDGSINRLSYEQATAIQTAICTGGQTMGEFCCYKCSDESFNIDRNHKTILKIYSQNILGIFSFDSARHKYYCKRACVYKEGVQIPDRCPLEETKTMKINELINAERNSSLRSHLETIDARIRKIAIYLGIVAVPGTTEEKSDLRIDELIKLADIIEQRLDPIFAELLKLGRPDSGEEKE